MAEGNGVRLALEFMSLGEPIGPFVLDSLADTVELVERVAHPALGISVDFFHHFRGGGGAAELRRLDSALISNVHVTDVRAGPANRSTTAIACCRGKAWHRLPPIAMPSSPRDTGGNGRWSCSTRISGSLTLLRRPRFLRAQ